MLNRLSKIFENRLTKDELSLLVGEIELSQKSFDQTVDLMLRENNCRFMASWCLGYAGIQRPNWFYNRLEEILASEPEKMHDSVLRNTLRVLWKTSIPEEHFGRVLDLCFKTLNNNSSTIAAKAFSLHILSNLVRKIPSLQTELKGILEQILPYSSAAVRNIGYKLLNKLNGKMNRA